MPTLTGSAAQQASSSSRDLPPQLPGEECQPWPTAAGFDRLTGQFEHLNAELADSATTVLEATRRIEAGTRTLLGLAELARTWETQAAECDSASVAEILKTCAGQLRETVRHAHRATGPAMPGPTRTTTDQILAGLKVTPVTRRIVALAVAGGLDLQVESARPARGRIRIDVNGPGRDSLFGAIFVGARTGRILRAVLSHGNDGPERTYLHVAEVRAVFAAWAARPGSCGSSPAAEGDDAQ